MLYVILIIYIVLIFPIFINVKLKFDKDKKKVFFKIKLFNIVRVINGYIENKKDGFFIHLTKKKAILFEYERLFDFRKKVRPLKDYHIISFNSQVLIGSNDNLLKNIEIAFIFNYLVNNIQWFFYHKKPYLYINNSIKIYDDKVFIIKISVKFVLNLLMIFISLIKILMEKMFYAITRKVQQN